MKYLYPGLGFRTRVRVRVFTTPRTHLRLLHRPVVLISSLDLSREAFVDLAQSVRQDAQVLLDLGLLFLLLQDLPVHLAKRTDAGPRIRQRGGHACDIEQAGGARLGSDIRAASWYSVVRCWCAVRRYGERDGGVGEGRGCESKNTQTGGGGVVWFDLKKEKRSVLSLQKGGGNRDQGTREAEKIQMQESLGGGSTMTRYGVNAVLDKHNVLTRG